MRLSSWKGLYLTLVILLLSVVVLPAPVDKSVARDFNESETIDHEKLEKRIFARLLSLLFPVVVRGLQAAAVIGMRLLVSTAQSAVAFCQTNPKTCLDVANTIVGIALFSVFAGNNGINARDINGHVTINLNGTKHFTHATAHIDLGTHSTLASAVQKNNNTEWLHIATVYAGESSEYVIHHRLAHPDDLGHDNDGTYHHIQASPASSTNPQQRRAEDDDGGIVSDYLWRANSFEIWDDLANAAPENVLSQNFGDQTSAWQQDNLVEATCGTVLTEAATGEGPQEQVIDMNHAVLAYGWNNAAFNFAGRAGGWVDGCAS